MKHIKLRSLAAIPFLLCAIDLAAMTNLKDISKPYAGTYDCEYILFNGDNLLDKFDYVQMELLPSGLYKIEFRDANGIKGLYRGHYTYDTKEEKITIDENIFGKKVSKTFPVEKGEISVPVQYGDLLLYVKFKMR